MSIGSTGTARVAASDGGATEAGNVPASVTVTPLNAAGASNSPTKLKADFLRRVVPWSAAGAQGVINLHYTMPERKGMPGKPFADVASLLAYLPWIDSHPAWYKDVYFCLSLQAQTGTTPQGKVKAARHANAALALKALWLDVDGYKDYPSKTVALAAIAKFITDAGLPPLTALVDSGGGWHVYWISDKPLLPDEWRQYAEGLWALVQKHGLKADPVTTDAARVLRVPGTFNKKQQVPRPVKVVVLADRDIDFAVTLGWLKGIAPPPPRSRAASLPPGNVVDLEQFKGGPSPALRAAIPQYPDRLGDGIEQPLDLRSICRCPHYADALRTGGKDHNQGLWMQTVLGATWIENGREVAHALSNKHPGYSVEECDAMFDRKMADRQDMRLGWPSCETFKNYGCKLCPQCSHFAKGKSPLHLGRPNGPAVGSPGANSPNAKSQSPAWPDPLDFDTVPEEEAVARLNAAGYFVLTLNGDIYKIEPGGGVIVQKREGFNNLFACRQASREDGEISAGAAWKWSRARTEYASIGYWPGNHGRPPKAYNLWPGWGVEPKQGDWSNIHDHILNVIAGADKHKANYILDWCAHMVQRPWEKPGVALVLRGRKGTGKTLLTEILARVIGRSNTLITASGKKMFDTFNWHLADKLLIGAEEAFFVGNRELNDKLKHLLTGMR